MTDERRPLYVGQGTCTCGRVDVLLYRLPDASFMHPLACSACLEKAGFKTPRSRTADDIDVVDGKLEWKKS